MAVAAPEARSEAWHALRREGIGASDVAAICGMSTFNTPLDVWEAKRGLREPSADSPVMEWGRRLEPVIADAFSETTGIAIRRRSREVRYRDWPVLFAHLDRSTPEGPLEIKASMSTRGWGETGSADVPQHVGLQVQAQLLCTERPRAFVAALLGYRDFRWYDVPFDRELVMDQVLPILRDFWDGVESGIPPEPDGSESYSAFLRRMHPRDERPERPATPEEGLLVASYLVADARLAEATTVEALLKQRLQDAIAADGGLVGPGYRISWKASRETDWRGIAEDCGATAELIESCTSTDWRAVAKTLKPRPALVDLRSTFTGSRRFLVTTEEE